MTVDPQAIKRAEEFVEKGLTKYEKDEEVAEDLEVSDASVLRPLPLYALANRIKKFVFIQGFTAGYSVRKLEEPENKTTEIDYSKLKKLERAEKKIRLLKIMVKILTHCLSIRVRGNTEHVIAALLRDGINNVTKSDRVKSKLMHPFSDGDLRAMPLLSAMKKVALEESDKN